MIPDLRDGARPSVLPGVRAWPRHRSACRRNRRSRMRARYAPSPRRRSRSDFEGQVTVGHCCSLARQEPDDADRTIDLVAGGGHRRRVAADVQHVSAGSSSGPHAALARRHAAARDGARAAFRRPWPPTIPATPSMPMAISMPSRCSARRCGSCSSTIRSMRRHASSRRRRPPCCVARMWPHRGRRTGRSRAVPRAGWTEFLSRPQSDRIVIRGGKAIDRTLPDYRELDSLLGR